MAQDYFATLGLRPGRYSSREVARHFVTQRRRVLGELYDADRHHSSRERLEALHQAYRTLSDPKRQAAYLRQCRDSASPVEEMRGLIAASLEDGLLRQSRRQWLVERAAALGFNEFQAQLLIAQVQFGDDEVPATPRVPSAVRAASSRAWARVAAVGVLALAMFVGLVQWVGA